MIRWPTLLDPLENSGSIRKVPQDFVVEELPAYLPSGRGEHLMIWVEKTGRTTEEVARKLARHLGVSAGELGYAGLKDRQAVTRQWFSLPARNAGRLDSFELDGVTILSSGLHGNKLKTGHLKGNRFQIRVRDIDRDEVEPIIGRRDELKAWGVPNYFGSQRFGPDGKNETLGLALLSGRKKPGDRRQLRFLLSAAQSGLFNDVLATRIREGIFARILPGDVLVKADTGGMFVCTDPEEDQDRVDNLEVHPTGPMFGAKMKAPQGDALSLEQRVLENSGISPSDFSRFPKLTRGTRRALRLVPQDLKVGWDSDLLRVSFSLPPGGYATSVLRELIGPELG